MRPLSLLLLATASLVAIVLACLTPVSIAFADATFVKSGPPPGSTVDARIQVVTIVFSEALDPAKSAIVVTGSDGSRADQGDVHLDPLASQVMLVSLKPSRSFGRYTVQWTSRSAVDGQTRTGSFDFTIAPVVQTVPEPNAMLKWALPDNAVEVVFGERLNPLGSTITVVGPDGNRADQGDAEIDPKDPTGATLRVSLIPNARAGAYQVAWTAVAAGDGSTFSNSFRFTLLQDQKPGLPDEASPGLKGGSDDAWAIVRATLPADLPVYRPTWLPTRFRQDPLPPRPGADSDSAGSPPIQVTWIERGELYSIRAERGTGSATISREELLRVASSLAPLGPNVAEVAQLPRGGGEPGLMPLALGGMLLLAGLTIRRRSVVRSRRGGEGQVRVVGKSPLGQDPEVRRIKPIEHER